MEFSAIARQNYISRSGESEIGGAGALKYTGYVYFCGVAVVGYSPGSGSSDTYYAFRKS